MLRLSRNSFAFSSLFSPENFFKSEFFSIFTASAQVMQERRSALGIGSRHLRWLPALLPCPTTYWSGNSPPCRPDLESVATFLQNVFKELRPLRKPFRNSLRYSDETLICEPISLISCLVAMLCPSVPRICRRIRDAFFLVGGANSALCFTLPFVQLLKRTPLTTRGANQRKLSSTRRASNSRIAARCVGPARRLPVSEYDS